MFFTMFHCIHPLQVENLGKHMGIFQSRHELLINWCVYQCGLDLRLKSEISLTLHVKHLNDLATVYNDLSSKNMLAGFEVYERFYEIGSLSGIEETSAFITKFMSKEVP